MKTYLLLAAAIFAAANVEVSERESRTRWETRTLVSQAVRSLEIMALANERAGNDREAGAFDSLAVYGRGLVRQVDSERGADPEVRAFREKLDRWLVVADSLREQGSADLEPCRDAVATLPPLD